MDIKKLKLSAGGYEIIVIKGKGNTRFGEKRKALIIEAFNKSFTEGVYITETGLVKRQLMNGTCEYL